MTADALARALISECENRLFDESLPRLRKCLGMLSEEEIWSRPNSEANSVGNLVLHLCGNVRQWVCTGLGGQADVRDRAREFSERGPIPTRELIERLELTMAEARAVIRELDVHTLLEKRPVQIYEENAVTILIHVTEHFSYHVGQIAYFVKARKGGDLGFYAGADLNRRTPGKLPGP
jgi:uncharacterized damage-inducible protein DinB